MKSGNLMCITVMTLCTIVAIPVWLAGQDNTDHKPRHHHYQLIDMGTFGGPESFVAAQFFAFPDLNNLGVTVGGSATSIPTSPTSNFLVC